MNYKQTILSVNLFFENRPDMSIHTNEAVQSAIFTSASLLNSETAGLLEKCWDYNNSTTPPPEISNEFYRNTWELSQIVEAMITQTQYIINMGNDFSQGGGSYSIGNVNASYNRPIDRDTIAPGVHKLLQNARVFNLQSFLGNGNNSQNDIYDPYNNECISRAIGDKRYVSIDQPNVVAGNIAYVNENQQVSFGNPQDLNIATYDTTRIKQWNSNDYVTIDKVNELAFFGENLWGFRSAMTRYQIYNAIAMSKQSWMSEYVYGKHSVVTYYDEPNNMLLFFVSLKDVNKGHVPITSTEWWKQVNLGDISVDINYIVDAVYNAVVERYDAKFNDYIIQTKEYVDTKYQEQNQELINTIVPNEVRTQLNALPTIDYVSEGSGETIEFSTQQDFEDYKTNMEVDDTYFQPQTYNQVDIQKYQQSTSQRVLTIVGEETNEGDKLPYSLTLNYFFDESVNGKNTTLNLNNNYNGFSFLPTNDSIFNSHIFRLIIMNATNLESNGSRSERLLYFADNIERKIEEVIKCNVLIERNGSIINAPNQANNDIWAKIKIGNLGEYVSVEIINSSTIAQSFKYTIDLEVTATPK